MRGTIVLKVVLLASTVIFSSLGFNSVVAEQKTATALESWKQVVKILVNQAEAANSGRASLEIQMRVLTPAERRQAEELGEVEYQLRMAVRQLDKGQLAAELEQADIVPTALKPISFRQLKQQWNKFQELDEDGPAGELQRVASQLNEPGFFACWQAREQEISRNQHRQLVCELNARLLVARRMLAGDQPPDKILDLKIRGR